MIFYSVTITPKYRATRLLEMVGAFTSIVRENPSSKFSNGSFPVSLKICSYRERVLRTSFLVYLEWSALRSALIQYLGRDEDVDTEHFEVASVEYNDQEVQIIQVIRPNTEMPKIQSCFQRSRLIIWP